jgi:3-deoxy-7-phosphoheptulonate synthase
VTPLALAAVAAGADGLIVEVHPAPCEALSDGEQSLDFAAFDDLMTRVALVAAAVGRTLQAPLPLPHAPAAAGVPAPSLARRAPERRSAVA